MCEVAEPEFKLKFCKTPNPGLWHQTIRVQIPAPPLTSCVYLGNFLNLFHLGKMGVIKILAFLGC